MSLQGWEFELRKRGLQVIAGQWFPMVVEQIHDFSSSLSPQCSCFVALIYRSFSFHPQFRLSCFVREEKGQKYETPLSRHYRHSGDRRKDGDVVLARPHVPLPAHVCRPGVGVEKKEGLFRQSGRPAAPRKRGEAEDGTLGGRDDTPAPMLLACTPTRRERERERRWRLH